MQDGVFADTPDALIDLGVEVVDGEGQALDRTRREHDPEGEDLRLFRFQLRVTADMGTQLVGWVAVVGGVAASPQLREGTTELCERMGVKLCLPPLKWSTDNAAMIGLAAWDYLNEGVMPPLAATASLKITEF